MTRLEGALVMLLVALAATVLWLPAFAVPLAWVLLVGGCCAVIAAWVSGR